MAQYTKSTNFATKDSLPLGDPAKIVKGTELDTEFNNIATAVGTKADLISPTFTGTPTAPTASPGTNTTQIATTAFTAAAIQANQASVAITGGTITGITDLAIADGGTGASTASAAFANLKQAATETATGVVELATTAEAEAGTDTTRAVTPAGVEAHMVANALGWGQTWQDVTGSRANATNYTNNTGRPIVMIAEGFANNNGGRIAYTVGGQTFNPTGGLNTGTTSTGMVVIPPGATYRVDVNASSLLSWRELR